MFINFPAVLYCLVLFFFTLNFTVFAVNYESPPLRQITKLYSTYGTDKESNCHSLTQPQHELELDLIMGRNPPTTQELLRHFQAT